MINQDDIDAFAEYNKPTITRVEVIGNDGRILVKYCKSATVSMQDDGRTMKVFLIE